MDCENIWGAIQVNEFAILLFGGYNGNHDHSCFQFNVAEKTLEVLECKLPKGCSFVGRNAAPIISNSSVYAMKANSFDMLIFDIGENKWTSINQTNLFKIK